MRSILIRSTLLLIALVPVGCTGTIIREASGALLGAKGTFTPLQPLAAEKEAKTLGEYTHFELGTITDSIGGQTPENFLTYLREEFPEQVLDARLPDNNTGKTLVIRGSIIYYESASTVGYALGPLEEVICRTELVDKATGQILGTANCVGRTKAVNNSGVKSKASGLAKAFVKWIEFRFPEDLKTPKK